jgi:hypothetical protein
VSLPRALVIGGKRWRVRRGTIRSRIAKNGKVVDQHHWGRTYAPSRTITIAWGLTPAQQLQTLVHEVLHAALWDLDEEAIERAESALGQALGLSK